MRYQYFTRLLTLVSLAMLSNFFLEGQSNILSEGQLYRIDVDQTGVYGITGSWLQDNLDIVAGSLSSSSVHIYGVSSGPLKQNSTWASTERLKQMNISIDDGGDGNIDANDVIYFYGEDANRWIYNNDNWEYIKNPYAVANSYILKISSLETPKTITTSNEVVEVENPNDHYSYRAIYHEDMVNLLGSDLSTQGSGQRWFGKDLTNLGEVDFSQDIIIPQAGLSEVQLKTAFAGRSKSSQELQLRLGSEIIRSAWSPVNTGDVEELYARIIQPEINHPQLNQDDPIALRYDKTDAEAKLWLDWIQVSGETKISQSSQALIFNNIVALKNDNDGLMMEAIAASTIWDISDPLHPVQVNPIIRNDQWLIPTIDTLQEFIVFDPAIHSLTPITGQSINNNDVLTLAEAEMVVIYPRSLKAQADLFIRHRSNHSDIEVTGIAIEDLYNSYCAGRTDVSVIRNYTRDLYRTHNQLRYLLLFGDASYDYRELNQDLPRENLVPTFETEESLDPLFAFPSDDYFGLLDDGENGALRGDLDIAVGRITVSNPSEAASVVNKIITYDTDIETQGAWRTNIAFLADDEDRNLHINDADRIAVEVARDYPTFNQEKIYFDAFRQASTPGGNRYPAATEKLNKTVENGALIINYLGHGGPRGWSQERVLKIDDITSWSNARKLPLVVTATCSFTGFDDPAVNTAGEAVLLNPAGGAIALFTTVRSVFASKNFRLTQSVFRQMFEQEQGQYLTIGEIMRRGKNSLINDNLNGRKFFLIGDPSLTLAIPNYTVETTTINGEETNASEVVDTIGALDLSTITGQVLNPLGEVASDFNGSVDITIFDKPTDVSTLGNDDRSFVRSFSAQNNFIYKGKARVSNGRFETQWRVPIDIDYSPGLAKISYYAVSDTGTDAIGVNQQLAVSGASDNPPLDNEGPDIDIYLNDRSFSSGDIVNKNNLVIAELRDASGINLSTAGIGHEITSTVDGEVAIINQFYIPSEEDANAGMLVYDLSSLEEGQHSLTIKAFDVLNNPGEATISFEVKNGLLSEISSIFISPNPSDGNPITVDILTDSRVSQANVELSVYDALGRLLSRERDLIANTNGRILAPLKYRITSTGLHLVKVKLTDLKGNLIADEVIEKVLELK